MRNNPKFGNELEYGDLFTQYASVEKLRRFFQLKRQKVFKHFTLQPYQSNFTFDVIEKYVADLDEFLLQKGKMKEGFKAAEWIEQPEDAATQIGFDAFYDALSKWGVQQTEITYDDLSQCEANPQFVAL